MAEQLHKRFSTEEVKVLFKNYCDEEVKLPYILEILCMKRSRFFDLFKAYRKDPERFSIQYTSIKEKAQIER